MSSLYELTGEFALEVQKIQDLLESGIISEEAASDTMDALKYPLEMKMENIVKYMKSLEALAKAKEAEAKRLSESAVSDLKKVEWFKNYMADNLQKANIKTLQAGVFALNFKKGSEVVELNESLIPVSIENKAGEVVELKKFVATEKILGKPELKKLIKEGLEIPGVALVRKPDTLVVK